MRLIDADEFKEIIVAYGNAGFSAIRINKICELIDGQSTVYDINKIINKIEMSSTDKDGVFIHVDKKPVISKELAIEIVKSGGVSDD